MAPILPSVLPSPGAQPRGKKVSSGRKNRTWHHRTQHSQTQLFGRFRLVITRTLLADLAIGIAQQTTRGVERPLLLMADGG